MFEFRFRSTLSAKLIFSKIEIPIYRLAQNSEIRDIS